MQNAARRHATGTPHSSSAHHDAASPPLDNAIDLQGVVLTEEVRCHPVRSLFLTLFVGLAASLLAWIFILLGSEMADGDTRAFDILILRSMQVLRDGHPWAAAVMRDLSGLGSTTVLVLFTSIAVGYLVLVSARRMAWLVVAAVCTGEAGIGLLKVAFARARPGAAFADALAPGMSFPSGHAGMSAIVFLSLGALLASTRARTVERSYILAVATFMTLLVGLSGVALGVHWATDVLAGWAYGSAWALIWLLLASRGVTSRGPVADRYDAMSP